MTAALTPLLALPDVAPSLAAARSAVDAALRVARPDLATEVGLRAAVASAALEGHPYEVEEVRAGTITDPVVQGCLRVGAELVALARRWRVAPRQVLARLHVLAARGTVTDDRLGRPTVAGRRLDLLCELVTTPVGEVPSLLRAAVVHGELLALRPFPGPSGVIARAAARLTLMADGLDPAGLIAPELGHQAREPEYVGSANAFATGTADGVRSWLRHTAMAVEVGAAELSMLADGGGSYGRRPST
jgi:hypothetical protein